MVYSKSINEYFTDIIDFITSLPLIFYIGYYGTIALIAICILGRSRIGSSTSYYLLLLLLFALYVEFPRYIFTYPFQREVFHQAQIIHVHMYSTISSIPPHNINVANPIFWGIFIKITALEQLLIVLYFAPTFMWFMTIVLLFTVVKSLSGNSYISFVSVFFFQSSFFEFFFASRYAYASPLFVLFIGLLIKLLVKPTKSIVCLLIPLTLTMVMAHIGFSTLALATTVVIAFIYLVAWYQHKLLYENLIERRKLIYMWCVAIPFFIAYGLWYFVLWRFQGINIWLNVVISALHEGFSKLKLIEAVYRLPLEPIYELIVNIRIAIALSTILLLSTSIIFQSSKNNIYRVLRLGLAATYILYLLPLGIGVIEGVWSLRPFHILMLFSPILIASLFPRRLFKLLIILSLLFSSTIVYVLWIPNLGYIQVPDKKVELVKYASTYIPQNQVLGVLGMDPVERTLFTHIFSNRKDLQIVPISHVLSRDWKHLEVSNIHYILVDPSIEKYEVKYICTPSIRERVQLLSIALIIHYYFNKVYDIGSFYILLHR